MPRVDLAKKEGGLGCHFSPYKALDEFLAVSAHVLLVNTVFCVIHLIA